MSDELRVNIKFFLRTFGCQMNVRDSEIICGLLKNEGYALTEEPNKADVILFNTCSVRQHAEDRVWSGIGKYKTKGPSLSLRTNHAGKKIIGVIGCMAQEHKEKIFEKAPQVDFVVGPSDIDKIPSIIKKLYAKRYPLSTQNLFETRIWETDGKLRPEGIYHAGFYESKEHAYVVISEGCSNLCSYCLVPYVRGPLHNRNHKDILEEIEGAIDKGVTKITLLGQNVNAYKSQVTRSTTLRAGKSPVNFIELLRLVNEIKGLEGFSFITSHPKDIPQELFTAMAELDKLKKHLHLPVQSGSDRILRLMNRGYTSSDYRDLIKRYREVMKGGILSTDIMVGFPTETEEDFQGSCFLLEEIEFDGSYVFKYSVRPHTDAASFNDDVPKEEKERRHKILLDLQKAISRRKGCLSKRQSLLSL